MDIGPLAGSPGGGWLAAWADALAAGAAGEGGVAHGLGNADAVAAAPGADAAGDAHRTAHPDAVQAQRQAAPAGAAVVQAQTASPLAAPAASPLAPASPADPATGAPGTAWAATAPSAFGDSSLAPLAPVWVPPLFAGAPGLCGQPLASQAAPHGPRVQRPQARDPRRQQPGRQPPGTSDDAEAGDARHDEAATADEGAAWPCPLLAEPGTLPLPAAVQAALLAELRQGRAALLIAPLHAGLHVAPRHRHAALQAWWLRTDPDGRPGVQRQPVRGAVPATGLPADGWWRLRRPADAPAHGMLPVARAGMTGLPPLLLRITATLRPPPLRGPETLWLDLLEPQRVRRALGRQWTWLTAWTPQPTPWMD